MVLTTMAIISLNPLSLGLYSGDLMFPVRYELTLYLLVSPVPGGNKYRNLALQIGGISNLR
jgi:hypothetical protein